MRRSSYKPVEPNKDNKMFLLIGTFRNEKIINELHLAGKEIVSKNLTSSPDNWDRINAFIKKNRNNIDCIAFSLSESILLISQCETYKKRFFKMLNLIKDITHMIFLYEDNRFSKFNIFNTRYYKKYLFYDDFFVNREAFKRLLDEYSIYSTEVKENIISDYFYNVLLPAAFLSEEDEWNLIKKSDLSSPFPFDQISLFDSLNSINNEDELTSRYLKKNRIISFIDSLRSELKLTKEEREVFLKLPSYEQIAFIDNKCQDIREKYISNAQGKNIDFNLIESLLKSDEFLNSMNESENWRDCEWKVFETYLKEKHLCEDKEIRKAINSMNEIIEKIYEMKFNIITYKYSNDIVRYIRDYIENEGKSVVFRSYILKDQIWANELDDFLSLFQEYVIKIRGVDISFVQRKTDIGTIYVLTSSNKEVAKSEFPRYVSEFNTFLDYCDNNVSKAKEVLESFNIDESDVSKYIFEFQKRTRRLMVDIRQEFEIKMLECRHAIENEALENTLTTSHLSLINLPQKIEPSIVIDNLNVFELNETTAPIVFGNYTYNNNDQQIIDYIRKYAEDKAELETELRILKDKKLGRDDKVSAFEKIKTFLGNHALDIGEIAFKTLCKYLEGLL